MEGKHAICWAKAERRVNLTLVSPLSIFLRKMEDRGVILIGHEGFIKIEVTFTQKQWTFTESDTCINLDPFPNVFCNDPSLTFSHCHLLLTSSLAGAPSVCSSSVCQWSWALICAHLSWLISLILSPHSTTPIEIALVTAGSNSSGGMWPSWPLTSTRTTPKISLAAWMWRQHCMVFILCPMTCAVMLPKRC